MSMMIFTLLMTLQRKKLFKTLGYKPNPLFGKKFQKIFCKNHLAYRPINTVLLLLLLFLLLFLLLLLLLLHYCYYYQYYHYCPHVMFAQSPQGRDRTMVLRHQGIASFQLDNTLLRMCAVPSKVIFCSSLMLNWPGILPR